MMKTHFSRVGDAPRKSPKVHWLVLFSMGALLSCKGADDAAPTTTVSTVTATTATVTASVTAPLYVKVSTAWETADTVFSLHDTCKVSVDAAAGSTTECSVSIPEAQLFYSKLRFTVGSSTSAQCTLLSFQPYYYKLARTSFTPYWSDVAIDCATAPISNDCYNGPAVEIVEDFDPTNGYTATYHRLEEGAEKDYEVSSANSKLRTDNRWTSNDLAASSRASNLGDADNPYIGSSMRDYTFTCKDAWNQPQSTLILTITDQDTTASEDGTDAEDHFETWKEF